MANNSLEDLKKRQQPTQSTNSEDKMTGIDDLIPRNAKRIRVGRDYQAVIPKLMLLPKNLDKIKSRSTTVWLPAKNISDVELNDFVSVSKEQNGFSMEQALGLLYSNGHDLEKSNRDLSIFAPVDNWSIFDTTRFEYAFDKLGKDFVGIREMLPNKKLETLVCYYYLWKKRKTVGKGVIFEQAYQVGAVFEEDSQYSSLESSSPESESNDVETVDDSPALLCSYCGVSILMFRRTHNRCVKCSSRFRNDRGVVGSSQDNLHLNVNCGALQSTASGSSGQGEPMEDKTCVIKSEPTTSNISPN